MQSQRQKQVTDRLLNMGKIYDEKKHNMKLELEKRKKEEEDEILSNLKFKY